jgi:P2-related tail formation protein
MVERRRRRNAGVRKIFDQVVDVQTQVDSEDHVHAELYSLISEARETSRSNAEAIQKIQKQLTKFEPILELQEEIAAVGRFGARLTVFGKRLAIFSIIVTAVAAGISTSWNWVADHFTQFFNHG